jgi:hypothetical protein
MGERNWILEQERQQPGANEYYFSDSPWTSDEAFPEIARGEMAKKKIEKPEWASWK